MAYKDASTGLAKLLHFRWHHFVASDVLSNTESSTRYRWVALNLPEEVAEVISQFCSVFEEKHRAAPSRHIGSGLRYTDGTFKSDPLGFLTNDGCGLTCATFVMALLKTYGLELLRQEEWPQRLEDQSFHERIVQELEEKGAETEHVEAVRKEIGCARYRPEEVAAAALLGEFPVGFNQASSLGVEIARKLKQEQPSRLSRNAT
ncbi:hypothetical protein [Myxococcus eversor]|uniref:hypothetical protein n=1 Tax=Myxococcus eversor TaxID=2709661 RepID=UPI0013D5F0BC|nr:hypothetical protein [Myxococcus eversor]